MSPRAYSPRAAICPRRACSRRTAEHLSLVLARAAGAVVGARPARGAVPEGISRLAQSAEGAAQPRLPHQHRPDFRGVIAGLRRAARGERGHLDHRRHAKGLRRSASRAASRTASRLTAAPSSSAASTACAWARVLRRIDVQPRARRLEDRPCALVEACLMNDIVVIDCQLPSRHLKSLGSRPISRANFAPWCAHHAAPEAQPMRVSS
jgi:hypothetical protein